MRLVLAFPPSKQVQTPLRNQKRAELPPGPSPTSGSACTAAPARQRLPIRGSAPAQQRLHGSACTAAPARQRLPIRGSAPAQQRLHGSACTAAPARQRLPIRGSAPAQQRLHGSACTAAPARQRLLGSACPSGAARLLSSACTAAPARQRLHGSACTAAPARQRLPIRGSAPAVFSSACTAAPANQDQPDQPRPTKTNQTDHLPGRACKPNLKNFLKPLVFPKRAACRASAAWNVPCPACLSFALSETRDTGADVVQSCLIFHSRPPRRGGGSGQGRVDPRLRKSGSGRVDPGRPGFSEGVSQVGPQACTGGVASLGITRHQASTRRSPWRLSPRTRGGEREKRAPSSHSPLLPSRHSPRRAPSRCAR
jgi:hypothetical protein